MAARRVACLKNLLCSLQRHSIAENGTFAARWLQPRFSSSAAHPADTPKVRPQEGKGRVSFVNTLGDQSKNPFNPNLYPEELIYGDPLEDLSPLERKLSKDVVAEVNAQISEQSHGRLFAVIRVGAMQFRVTDGDIIMIMGTYHLAVGEKIHFEKVLAAGSSDFTLLGRPILDRDLVRVDATVIEKSLSYPVVNFVHIKPIPLRRRRFLRHNETMIRINRVSFQRRLNEVSDSETVVHNIH